MMMRDGLGWVAILGAVVLGIWLLTRPTGAQAWSERARPGAGVTIVRVVREVSGNYLYYISYDEVSGQVFGPFTESEVRVQAGLAG